MQQDFRACFLRRVLLLMSKRKRFLLQSLNGEAREEYISGNGTIVIRDDC